MQDREYYLVYLNTWLDAWELFNQEFDTSEDALGFSRAQSIGTRIVKVTMIIMEDDAIEGRLVHEEE
jgi:hypothetical protein